MDLAHTAAVDLRHIAASRPCPKMITHPSLISLIDVLFVIVPNSLLLDIAGPAEAFRLANLHRASRGQPPRFRLRFTGPASTVQTSVGLTVDRLEALPPRLNAPTWVVLVRKSLLLMPLSGLKCRLVATSGRTMSISQLEVAEPTPALPARSRRPAPLTVSAYVPSRPTFQLKPLMRQVVASICSTVT